MTIDSRNQLSIVSPELPLWSNRQRMVALVIKCFLQVATLTALVLSSSACTPRYVYDTPDFRTKIVDAQTKLPIRGAKVTVWARDNPLEVGRGISDVNGNVFVGSLIRKTWVFANSDPLPPNGLARIEAKGYVTR